ncbi:pyruvate, phosphate dikinase/phosphoenolpyruvate synthase regulator [Modestobacter sp. VKM Ac-2986]|uniref:pyruvate, water dikinase regulatory protein n=1 Tax=Modestobacter sp. VKM Ac-2986 TaxID=3004140 RepID=UPI0022AABA9D|nr:pyruvate, phosphate dikinase/phosphoenolpyruvate synthase regulator [Modestobacter sp. VKM Ac-2986]MCZ2829137.1 pyruvate, phosphate dikinase/phosphoenolpyruvate synthase regulator [Modestobacter sp. VKM Ac-2986]
MTGPPAVGPADVVPVFFLSDSTGISAETMGNALLIQFPDLHFDRTLVPFIATVEQAREVVAQVDEAMDGPVPPLVFLTAAVEEVRAELLRTRAPVIDFFGLHMARVEAQLGAPGLREARRLHGVGDVRRYNDRMAAIEFAIEHDDGLSPRGLDRADVVLLAPSRCGKTPTAMYLALQHGLFVANYPLVEEDLVTTDLPRPVRELADRCFGLTTTVSRLSRVRQERRPDSRYSSEEQCRAELRRATAMYDTHDLPTIDTSAASVEEIAAMVVQTLARRRRRPGAPTPSRPAR